MGVSSSKVIAMADEISPSIVLETKINQKEKIQPNIIICDIDNNDNNDDNTWDCGHSTTAICSSDMLVPSSINIITVVYNKQHGIL